TENSNPKACNKRRDNHDPEYIFANRSPSRYPRNKCANKRRPSNHPRPVKNRPITDPRPFFILLETQTILYKICYIIADYKCKRFENKTSRTSDKCKQ